MDWNKARDLIRKADKQFKNGPQRPKGIPWPEVEKSIEGKPITGFLKADQEIESFIPPLKELAFTGPALGAHGLATDTPSKFSIIYHIKLLPGFYGPFFRYSPDEHPKTTNETGGYFTDVSTNCAACATSRLALFDGKGARLYPKNFLYRYEFYFDIKDAGHADILVGTIPKGNAIQLRPTNWILGWNNVERAFNSNRILYKANPELIPFNHHCKRCRPFWSLYKPLG